MPWEFHGQKSLMGYSLWGHKESDTTKQLTPSLFFFFPWHFPYTCYGESVKFYM